MPPKKIKVAAQNRERRKREKREGEEVMLPASSTRAPELVDPSTSDDSYYGDQNEHQACAALGLPEMAAGPLAASHEDIQQRLQESREELATFLRQQRQQQILDAELRDIDVHQQLFDRFDLSEDAPCRGCV